MLITERKAKKQNLKLAIFSHLNLVACAYSWHYIPFHQYVLDDAVWYRFHYYPFQDWIAQRLSRQVYIRLLQYFWGQLAMSIQINLKQ